MDIDLKEILNRIKVIKEDFEMLQDGRWNLDYSDESELYESIDNCDGIINAVERLNTKKNDI
jgi:hypothetical protein|tara:strand:+ start:796 stop:981 length:186 start_codon:yes stop_codon:yes gene_type:complete